MRGRGRSSARRARRAWRRDEEGYPVMILGPDEPLFLVACAALGRWLFRHRSAFAPFLMMGGVFLVAGLIHRHHPGWWAPLTTLTIVITAALGVPHTIIVRRHPVGRVAAGLLARVWGVCGLDRAIERAYAAILIAVTGGWMAAAIAHGPTMSPLPTLAMVATVILGIPWWAHRRRRARVRVERTLAAWPEIADTIGLTGAQIASVVVDAWGFTARLILRGGKIAGQVIDKIPAIESGFGLRPGSVRVFPDEHRADRCVVRVIETDPHAAPILWPGASVTSITQPLPLGLFEDASPAGALLLRRNALTGGMVGSGKSGILNVILAHLVACPDVRIWGIDLKAGMELQPWAPCLQRLATTPDHATALLADAITELDRRATLLADIGLRVWEPTPTTPALIIVIDEYAELPPDAHTHTDSIARRGRAVAVNLLAATQRPTQDAMGHGAVRSQMDIRICLRVRERRDVDLILGQGSFTSGWHAHTLTQPGTFLITAPEHNTPHRARAYLITDHQVTDHVTTHRSATAPDRAQDPSGGPQTAESGPVGVSDPDTPETALWAALRRAGPDGVPIRDLLAATGMTRPTLYRHLRAHAKAGRVVQTTRGFWRALSTPPPTPPTTPTGPGDGRRPPSFRSVRRTRRIRPRHPRRRPPGRDRG
ncbi:MAG: FtsK/SpoIIIE domain-containing protein [Pseudonocardiaceae bacterium]